MTDRITFRDKTYGVGDVVTVLATLEAADDLGGAIEFIQSLSDGPLTQKAAYALGQFLSSGLPRHVEFAHSRISSLRSGGRLTIRMNGCERDWRDGV